MPRPDRTVGRRVRSRELERPGLDGFTSAVWMIPVVVLAVNAFWWLPGIWLASTKGPSDFAFNHPEGVLAPAGADRRRPEAPVQSILLAAGLPGLVVADSAPTDRRAGPGRILRRRVCSGATWPGRRGRSISCSPAGIPTRFTRRWRSRGSRDSSELRAATPVGSHGVDHSRSLGDGRALLLIGDSRWSGHPAGRVDSRRLGSARGAVPLEPPVSPRCSGSSTVSTPCPARRAVAVRGRGQGLPGVPDPFQGGRFSGLLPDGRASR